MAAARPGRLVPNGQQTCNPADIFAVIIGTDPPAVALPVTEGQEGYAAALAAASKHPLIRKAPIHNGGLLVAPLSSAYTVDEVEQKYSLVAAAETDEPVLRVKQPAPANYEAFGHKGEEANLSASMNIMLHRASSGGALHPDDCAEINLAAVRKIDLIFHGVLGGQLNQVQCISLGAFDRVVVDVDGQEQLDMGTYAKIVLGRPCNELSLWDVTNENRCFAWANDLYPALFNIKPINRSSASGRIVWAESPNELLIHNFAKTKRIYNINAQGKAVLLHTTAGSHTLIEVLQEQLAHESPLFIADQEAYATERAAFEAYEASMVTWRTNGSIKNDKPVRVTISRSRLGPPAATQPTAAGDAGVRLIPMAVADDTQNKGPLFRMMSPVVKGVEFLRFLEAEHIASQPDYVAPPPKKPTVAQLQKVLGQEKATAASKLRTANIQRKALSSMLRGLLHKVDSARKFIEGFDAEECEVMLTGGGIENVVELIEEAVEQHTGSDQGRRVRRKVNDGKAAVQRDENYAKAARKLLGKSLRVPSNILPSSFPVRRC
mmetsp:Transcript_32362/g.85036  ORF Transcript_32362/g.85036 Transcript_32362/m.85036 type:complete len:548 (+) Transcript_32362:105-1748(+)